MGDSVAYSDVPEGFTVKAPPAAAPSYSDVPEGFTVKDASKSDSKIDTDKPRSFGESLESRFGVGWDDLTNPLAGREPTPGPQKGETAAQYVMRSAKKDIPEGMGVPLKMMGGFGKMVASPAGAAGETIERKAGNMVGLSGPLLEKAARDTGDLTEMVPFFPAVKSIPKIATGTVNTAGKVLGGAREAINAKADAMATKVPVTQPNAYIIKTLQKAGHTPEEIVDIVNRAKQHGMTIGEASNNPDLLGMERKISGMNNPGGETVRDFVKNRVDPNNNVSMPFQLKSIADPLVKEVNRASKEIGATVSAAPKTPLNMNKVLSSLASEKRPAGSAVTNTLARIDGLAEWAKEQGNTFAAWHRVKQEIYAIGKEAADPNAIAKLDKKTVTEYYNKVNDVLAGRTGDLPKELAETGAKYARENANFQQNLSGRTIADVLKAMPEGGTPASSLKYLYKQLAGNKELRDELFAGMPESQRDGMMKLLKAIKDSSRGSANDIVKSMQQGSPSFPLTTNQVIHKAYDKVVDLIFRKDYDGLGKALTSPEAEQIAKKLGYIKPTPPAKPILRLTYQPKDALGAEVHVNRAGGAKAASAEEQAAVDATRDRMEKLGYGPGILRAQDLHVIRAMEQKYGASELGKFMTEHKNEPIMGRAWEIPDTEYSQAVVDKMLGRDAMSLLGKLQKETQDSLNAELRTIWDAHKTTLGEMALESRRAIKEMAEAKGEAPPTPKFGHNNLGDKLLDAVNTGTPLQNVIPKIQP